MQARRRGADLRGPRRGPSGRRAKPARDGRIGWLRSPCLGLCDLAPAAMVTAAGESPTTFGVAPVDAAAIVARLEAGGGEPRTRTRRYARSRRRTTAPWPGRRRRPVVARRLPRPAAATRRSSGPSRSGPTPSSRRSRPPNSSVAAAPRSRPDGNGPPWRSRPPSPTTSSATPTSPSRARSRTGSSSRVTRSPSSKR